MVSTGLREMFDTITFLKPVHVLLEENRKVYTEIFRFIFVVFIYWLVSSAIVFVANYNIWYVTLAANSVLFAGYAIFLLIQVPVGSFIAFIVSRFFSSKGDILTLVTVNFFLASSASLMILVGFIPYAQFASLIMQLLGAVLYLYFLNEVFEKMFSITPIQSLILILFYFAIPMIFFAIYLVITGNFQIPQTLT